MPCFNRIARGTVLWKDIRSKFQTIEDRAYVRDQLCKAYEHINRTGHESITFGRPLLSAFTWGYAPQGATFWAYIDRGIINRDHEA